MPSLVFDSNAAEPKLEAANRGIVILSDGIPVILTHITGAELIVAPLDDAPVSVTDDVSATWGASYSSMTVDASDNLHIVFIGSGDDLRYCKLTKGSGHTWTAGTSEQVAAAPSPGTARFGRTDIEVVDSDVIVVAWNYLTYSGNVPSFRMRARNTSAAWGTAYSVNGSIGSDADVARACSIARTSTAASGGVAKVAFLYNFAGTGIEFGKVGVTLATGAIAIEGTSLNYPTSAPSYGHIYTLTGKWSVVMQVGHGTTGVTALAFEWNYTTGLTGGIATASHLDTRYPTTASTYPTTTHVSSSGVIFSAARRAGSLLDPSSTIVGDKAVMVRVRPSGTSWGPQFPIAVTDLAADDYAGLRWMRGGANRNLDVNPTQTGIIHVSYSAGEYHHTITYNEPPAAPTMVSPGVPVASGTLPVVDTDRPLLVASTPTGYGRRRLRYQIDTTNTFGGSESQQDQPVTDYATAGSIHSMQVTADNELYKSPWYVRAAAFDEFGTLSSYASPYKFTVLHAPSTVGWVPSGGQYHAFGGGTVTLYWSFLDPSPYDDQSAYQIQVVKASDNTSVTDTGKVTDTDEFGAVTIDAGLKGVQLLWRVKVWDSDDEPSEFSAWQSFVLDDAPVVTLTTPAAGAWDHPSLELEWSSTLASGATQVEYKVDVRDLADNSLTFTSGWVRSTSSTHNVARSILLRGHDYNVKVSVKDSHVLVGTDDADIEVDWTPPTAPTFVVDTSDFDDLGYVSITWTNDDADGDFLSWKVYARPLGETDWRLLGTYTEDVATYEHIEYFIGSSIPFEYVVVQVAERFGVEVESIYDPVTESAEGTHYWLLDVDTPASSIKLYLVTAEGATEEWDQERHNLLGRGRKDELGTRYGLDGSMTCQMRPGPDGRTAREQKDDVFAAKALGRLLVLRNPFGDLTPIGLGAVSYTRIAGVGTSEYVDMTIPFFEVVS